MAKKEQLQNKS
ncbi:hypothetical protein E2C01_087419 [Portunus trituberculatus]|uniref:Uncharacterized protein n=1 Tax=Portunus trituberculatus TaxID=210409 RepID=A0A5B7JDZ9_PORTR|nr:hypothetical protein [Portunus trituberculatus]